MINIGNLDSLWDFWYLCGVRAHDGPNPHKYQKSQSILVRISQIHCTLTGTDLPPTNFFRWKVPIKGGSPNIEFFDFLRLSLPDKGVGGCEDERRKLQNPEYGSASLASGLESMISQKTSSETTLAYYTPNSRPRSYPKNGMHQVGKTS